MADLDGAQHPHEMLWAKRRKTIWQRACLSQIYRAPLRKSCLIASKPTEQIYDVVGARRAIKSGRKYIFAWLLNHSSS